MAKKNRNDEYRVTNSYEEKPVKPFPFFGIVGNVISALLFMAYGAFLMLVYIPSSGMYTPDKKMWLLGLFAMLGAIMLVQGIFRKSTGTFWMSWIFLTCAVTMVIAEFTKLTYGEIYPLFIAAPAVASAATWIFSRSKSSHLKTIIFFGAIAFICALNSIKQIALAWYIIVPIIIIAAGGMILINALTMRKGRWDDGDRPQRSKPIE